VDVETLGELENLLGGLERDRECLALILTGSGDECFISGGDLRQLRELDDLHKGREMCLRGQRVLSGLEGLDIPVIAAVNGSAYGGGCEFALACDLRIASREAEFSFRQVKLGIMTGWGGATRLHRIVGRSQAMRLLLTGAPIGAEEARAIGLVDEVVPRGEVLSRARELAGEIVSGAPLAVRFVKRVLNHVRDMPVHAGIAYEAELFSILWDSRDHREAERAYFAKEKPRWKGK
jgi:enoyl-CoA hydratase